MASTDWWNTYLALVLNASPLIDNLKNQCVRAQMSFALRNRLNWSAAFVQTPQAVLYAENAQFIALEDLDFVPFMVQRFWVDHASNGWIPLLANIRGR